MKTRRPEAKAYLLDLPPNRVRRNYRGGAGLDRFEGRLETRDSDRPEDWIASTVTARNPGLPPLDHEGLSTVHSCGRPLFFPELLESDPGFFLGEGRHRRSGPGLGFLVKLLDSAMRLHVQAHPTAAFAQQHLGSPVGKLETYVILASRPGVEPYVRLGFQHLRSPAEWRRIVLEQDIPAMDACFEKIPVRPGEVWVVPGGVPHAIGEGLTVVEVMEPSDLVVRCEYVREGIEVPPPARFMGLDPDFALRIFDCVETPVEAVTQRYRLRSAPLAQTPAYRLERLIGSAQTSCFEVRKLSVSARCRIDLDPRFAVAIVVGGAGRIAAGDSCLTVRKANRFFMAAAVNALDIEPEGEEELELLLCLPGQASGPG